MYILHLCRSQDHHNSVQQDQGDNGTWIQPDPAQKADIMFTSWPSWPSWVLAQLPSWHGASWQPSSSSPSWPSWLVLQVQLPSWHGASWLPSSSSPSWPSWQQVLLPSGTAL